MKKGQLLIDWEGMARKRGYPNGGLMLYYRYVIHEQSTTVIASDLKVNATSVQDRLRYHNIALRPKGGANNRK